MKTVAMFAVLALACTVVAPACALEEVASSAVAQQRPALAAVPGPAVTPGWHLPELPEPDVVLMMLVGLVLISYRASRDNDEKFK
ncbi:hypothetical protein [Massilia sp. TSP1-1-2]|uniref:hypothetical protein n=1 Tax=Massilia sp. TSP1-1-2 TaxID=2804649 RepID=UPI003CF97EA1